MGNAFAVVHEAHDVTVFKAHGSVGPRQTMELLLQEPLAPPDELALFELDVHADLPPVGGNHFAHMHELRQFGAWCEYIGGFEPMRIAGLGQQGFGTLGVVLIVLLILCEPLRVPARQGGMPEGHGHGFASPSQDRVLDGLAIHGVVQGLPYLPFGPGDSRVIMGFAGQIIPPKHGKRRHGRDGGFEHFHALGRGLRLRIEGNQGQMGLAPHEHRQPCRRLGHQEELEFLELRRHPPVLVRDAFQ